MLLSGLVSGDDIRGRISIRGQLELAHIRDLIKLLKEWKEPKLDDHIVRYEEEEEADRREFMVEQNHLKLHSMNSPEDVLRSLLQQNNGSKAGGFLLNTFRHLLLIKEEGEERSRYFQLIDQLVGSIVMHDTPDLSSDFGKAFGISVSQLMGKFVEQQQLEEARNETKALKARLAQSEREKQDLVEEMSEGNKSLVDRLKKQIADLEERLKSSRAATEALSDQMGGMKNDYEGRISDLELYIQELFNMLRETNHLDQVQSMTNGPINRAQLVHDLREQWERKKTIRQLEGRKPKNKPVVEGVEEGDEEVDEEEEADLEDDEDEEEEDGEILEAEMAITEQGHIENRKSTRPRKGSRTLSRGTGAVSTSPAMESEEESVRSHIAQTLADGADKVVSVDPNCTLTEGTNAHRWRLSSRTERAQPAVAQRTANPGEVEPSLINEARSAATPLPRGDTVPRIGTPKQLRPGCHQPR